MHYVISFEETQTERGPRATLVAPELPAGFSCTIYPDGTGFSRKTKANGNGSIRYDWHVNYGDARAAAIKWAKRKIREARQLNKVGRFNADRSAVIFR